MISTLLTRVSATVLFLNGVALLFVPDLILPRLIPGFPSSGLWFGQLLGAAWFGVGMLNWFHQATLLGGIYGRPLLAANLAVYGVSALSLLRAAPRATQGPVLWLLALPALGLAAAYGWLLVRGPLARDLARSRAG